MEQRRLVLVRHAKAEPFAASDEVRPLSERGRADAAALGAWLAQQGVVPDVVLVSTAVRTRQTWEHLALAAGWQVEARFEGYLYGCDEDGLLELLATGEAEAATVLVVGHNPTIGSLANLLDDGDGEATGAAITGFPTGTAAVLDLAGGWPSLAPASARLRHLHVARS